MQRDYDKEPIVIRDYSRLFEYLFIMWAVVFVLFIIYFRGLIDSKLILFFGILALPVIFRYSQFSSYDYIFTLAKSKISKTLTTKNIDTSEIIDVNITFSDFGNFNYEYNKQPLKLIVSIVFIAFALVPLIVNKVIFHILKDGDIMLFDSFYIRTKSGDVINVMATSKQDFLDIKQYLNSIGFLKEYKKIVKFNYDYRLK